MTMPTALDWDAWRANYQSMTYADQVAYHSAIYAQYPEQRHYDASLVRLAINDTDPTTVIELGGWDGELAEQMLNERDSIQSWVNIEICAEASTAGRGRHPRYGAPELMCHYWHAGPWTCDLFVASHVIEHLTVSDLEQTIASTKAKFIYLDAPLEEHPTSWAGFTGTHILQTGWRGVDQILGRNRYTLKWAAHHQTDPSSGGHARACLYAHQGGHQNHETEPTR